MTAEVEYHRVDCEFERIKVVGVNIPKRLCIRSMIRMAQNVAQVRHVAPREICTMGLLEAIRQMAGGFARDL